VGVGTLYRRFPTKADLFNAVVDSARQRTDEIAREVLRDTQAGEAVFEFVGAASPYRVCGEPTHRRRPGVRPRGRTSPDRPLLSDIMQRSKEAGTLRADVEVTDIVIVLKAVRSIADLCDVPGSKPRCAFWSWPSTVCGRTPDTPAPPLSVGQLTKLLDRH